MGEPPAIQFVAVDRLQTDPAYQRSADNGSSRKLIDQIAHGWDWRLCVPLLVAKRPEGLFVIDGQHRCLAARQRGDIAHLPCSVVAFASPAEEAVTFAASNRQRKVMTKLDLFRAAVVAREPEAVVIDQLVRDAGLGMANTIAANGLKPGHLGFTTSLYKALRRHGRAVTSAALTAMGEAFGRQIMLDGAAIFGALLSIFANPPEGFDPDDLNAALRRFSAAEWGDWAFDVRGGGARIATIREAMLREIKAMRKGLPQ